mgnify:CR=1 FL=1|tara:strand:- start:483 stop:1892 length:1410 start_codon:yes stop_codon:yes gene_type:complete
MNLLSDLMQSVWDLSDWQPDTTDAAKNMLKRFINSAATRVFSDAPSLPFFREEVECWTHPVLESVQGDLADRISVNSTYSNVLDVPSAVVSKFSVKFNKDQMAGKTIELKSAAGEWVKRQILGFVDDASGGGGKFALDKFFPTVDTNMEYRIYEEAVLLPDRVAEIYDVSIWNESLGGVKVKHIPYGEALDRWLHIRPNTEFHIGSPATTWVDGDAFLRPPSAGAKVSADGVNTFNAGHEGGTFEYAYTLCLGKKYSYDMSYTDKAIPYMESSISKSTGSITTTNGGSGNKITFPDYGYLLGFGAAPLKTYLDFYYRIYRKQTVSTGGGSFAARTDDHNEWRLVGQTLNTYDTWTDRGYVPHIYEVFKQNKGYRKLYMTPFPDDVYRLKLKTRCRPQEYTDENQVLPWPREVLECMKWDAFRRLAYHLGDSHFTDKAENNYRKCLRAAKKRFTGGPDRVLKRKTSRVYR